MGDMWGRGGERNLVGGGRGGEGGGVGGCEVGEGEMFGCSV